MAFEQMGNLISIINKLQSEDLKIKSMNFVIMEKENGVIFQITSPEPDGKKLGTLISELMKEVVKAFGGEIKVSYRYIPLKPNEPTK